MPIVQIHAIDRKTAESGAEFMIVHFAQTLTCELKQGDQTVPHETTDATCWPTLKEFRGKGKAVETDNPAWGALGAARAGQAFDLKVRAYESGGKVRVNIEGAVLSDAPAPVAEQPAASPGVGAAAPATPVASSNGKPMPSSVEAREAHIWRSVCLNNAVQAAGLVFARVLGDGRGEVLSVDGFTEGYLRICVPLYREFLRIDSVEALRDEVRALAAAVFTDKAEEKLLAAIKGWGFETLDELNGDLLVGLAALLRTRA